MILLTVQCLKCGHQTDMLDLIAADIARHLAEKTPAAHPDLHPGSSRASHKSVTGPPGGGGSPDLKPDSSQQGSSARRRRTSQSKRSAGPSRSKRPQNQTPPDGGGGLPGDDALRVRVRRRLRAWLSAEKLTAERATRRFDMGASHQTLRNLLSPSSRCTKKTLQAVDAALDRIEAMPRPKRPVKASDQIRSGALFRKTDKPAKQHQLGEYDESKVQHVPTTWPEDRGVNALPDHTPPPRCGSTP